jgi:UDP-N-acetylmuramate--alanine ligase
MSAMAEILTNRGARVSGSDTDEVFYTDAILRSLGIPFREGFSEENVPEDARVVIYSAAYDPASHPELLEAARRGLPTLVYTKALGELSARTFSIAVAGVHGKTTTTGMAGSIVRALGLPGTVLVASAVKEFGNRSTLVQGEEFFCAETCEYRRHFLAFEPSVAVVTTVEAEHLDYYADEADVDRAFFELVDKLPNEGALIYCADDAGASRVADYLARTRPEVARIAYGHSAEGPFRQTAYRSGAGTAEIELAGFEEPFELAVPGQHLGLNAVASLAVVGCILVADGARRAADMRRALSAEAVAAALRRTDESADSGSIRGALSRFSGLARRSELLGRARGVLFMDDYGHHPTEVAKTLRGLREFYAPARLVCDFMSHTYTRTDALLPQFAEAFGEADEVILHDIYASARERYDGTITGEDLAAAVAERHGSVRYFAGVMDAAPYLRTSLREGDLFVTMGAGNNWQLSHALFEEFSE